MSIKTDGCTCPSGDGSLRWPCAEHPAVEQVEVERPEVVAWSNWKEGTSSHVPFRTLEEAERSVEASEIAATQGGPYKVKRLMTVDQHDRIVGALWADRDSWAEQAEQRLADWDEIRKERDAALARVAEFEAQAQNSVPDGYRLIRLEHFAAIKAQLNPEQVDAYRGRNVYDEDKVYANWNACRSALDEIKDVFQQIDWDAENELLAAAPGKEVGHE